jgi:hypothetical protein
MPENVSLAQESHAPAFRNDGCTDRRASFGFRMIERLPRSEVEITSHLA